MTGNEFDKQMARLANFYGDKAYPTERIITIYKSVRWFHPDVWQLAVDMIIAECERAPMRSKIMEFIRAAQNQLPDLQGADPNAHIRLQLSEGLKASRPCYKCFNTGLITVYRKWQGLNEGVLSCNCSWGDLVTKLPEYATTRRIEAHDPFYYVLGFDPNKRAKLDLYRHLPYRFNAQDSMEQLAEIYYSKEVNMVPLFWSPAGVNLSGFENKSSSPRPSDTEDFIRKIAKSKELEKHESDHDAGKHLIEKPKEE